MLETRFNHLALLLPSVKKAAKYLESLHFPIGPAELWEGEGTLEIYVGEKEKLGKLLLMEPTKEGSYKKALQKRGPGLHHLAIDVLNLENFMKEISSSGWLLHPNSVQTMKSTKTAWLCRPGVPTFIEVQERKELVERDYFISEVRMPGVGIEMFEVLGLHQVLRSDNEQLILKIDANEISFGDLL